MEPQELTMLPPGAPLPGAGECSKPDKGNINRCSVADMNAPYNQQVRDIDSYMVHMW